MSGCLLCLHLDLGLKTGFEFKVEVVLEHCDPLDQPPDHPFVVIRHRLLMLVQKGSSRSVSRLHCKRKKAGPEHTVPVPSFPPYPYTIRR